MRMIHNSYPKKGGAGTRFKVNIFENVIFIHVINDRNQRNMSYKLINVSSLFSLLFLFALLFYYIFWNPKEVLQSPSVVD